MNSLLLAPHNDDETLFASFLCLRHRPLVVVCLRSFRMGAPSYPKGPLPVDFATRERETERAMKVLGCEWVQLTRPDDPLVVDWAGFTEEIFALRPNPDIVFAPAYDVDGHQQHNQVAALADSLFATHPDAPDKVVHYTTYTSRGRETSETEVEYEPEWIARKHEALACYRSQSAHPATRLHFMADLREYVT